MPINLNPRTINQKFTASQSSALSLNDGVGAGIDVYKYYTGDGSSAAGWPAMTQWVSFQQM